MPEIITTAVTLARRKKLCQITSGAVAQLAPITHIAFGDAGVDAQGEPIAVDENQTALHHEVGRYPVESVTYPTETTARYTVTIPKADLAGKKLSETALVDGDGTLCVIKNMYAKGKDDGTTFTFAFDDEF